MCSFCESTLSNTHTHTQKKTKKQRWKINDNKSFRLGLVPRKLERKCKGKKIQRKSRRKEKVKENKKNRLKIDKLFFLLLQTHFIYFNSSI